MSRHAYRLEQYNKGLNIDQRYVIYMSLQREHRLIYETVYGWSIAYLCFFNIEVANVLITKYR